MSATVWGVLDRSMSRDKDGQRDYSVTWLIKTTSKSDGPTVVMAASGLPTVGSTWALGNDSDSYAHCWPTLKISPHVSSKGRPEPELWWQGEQLFSTKPISRCQDTSVTDPLSEPQRVSGSFCRFTKKAEKDRNGKVIKSSSHELITGIEKDANRPSVVVEQNVASLGLATFTDMIDTLNDATLWGLPARRIKLSNVSWERKLYGTCSYYYTRRFEFECRVRADDLFDLDDIADTGYKVVKGNWIDHVWNTLPGADPTNPNDFVIYKDNNGENHPQKILLDGSGAPLIDVDNPVFIPTVELYGESNFITLGIPTSF